jgi:hypothetical protein
MAQSTFSGPVASQNGFLIGAANAVSATTPGLYSGAGAPSFTAAKGSMYLNTTGSSTSTRAYINTDGGTTWTAVTTAA